MHLKAAGLHCAEETLRIRGHAERHPQLRLADLSYKWTVGYVDANIQRRGRGIGHPDASKLRGCVCLCSAVQQL